MNRFKTHAETARVTDRVTETKVREHQQSSQVEHVVHHEIERELRDVTPRRVRNTRATQTGRRWCINLFCAFLFVLYLMARSNVALVNEVARTGVFTTASVTSKEVRRGKSTSYILHELFFSPQMQAQTAAEHVSQRVYEDVSVGEKRPLTYLPRDPEIHYFGRVDANRVAVQQRNWAWGIGLAGCFIGSGFWWYEAWLRNRRNMLRYGLPVVGVVQSRKVVEGKSTNYFVTYRYTSGDVSHNNMISVDKSSHDALVPGTPLTVLVNPTRPQESLPYSTMTEVEIEGAAKRVLPGVKA